MKKYFKVLFIILLVIIPITVLADSKNSEEIITGSYQFSAIEGNNKQLQNSFVYKDSDFTKSSFKGTKSLEILSIQVAGASLSWYGSELDKYEIDFSQNDYNIKDFLNKMKFDNIESNKYYNSEKKENSMGVIIGQKKIIQDGKEYTLLAIIPRSAGYKQEWAGNFTIGSGELHEGFKSARDEILRFTKKYIEKNNIKGKLKVWTTGYSRGAAVSNMVGGFFAGGGIDYFGNGVSITPEDVYCYTIGTPGSIKNGVSKNIELSVSANRQESDYANDTIGGAFNYTKGGIVLIDSSIYNGIRNIISPDDAFPLLPPEAFGFTRYGQVVNSYEGLYSIEEMLKELESISEYVYGAYTNNGKIKKFTEKTFDLKTLSIVDKESNVSQIEFFKGRLNGLVSKIKNNKIYNDEYQIALKSAIGTYGMLATLTDDISNNSSMETSEMIYPLIYAYLAYASDELQNEGRASNEAEAISIAAEDLLTYFTGENIDKDTFKIDDFVKLVLKYLSDNENEPISDYAVSGILSLVPEEYAGFLSMFKVFSKNSDATIEESLKAFIRACYYGVDPESSAYVTYQEPDQARQLLYMTMLMAIGTDMPELEDLMMDQSGKIDGHGKFEDFVALMIEKVKNDESDNKKYSTIGELADAKLSSLIDNMLLDAIEKSEELYGKDYKNDLQKQVSNLKQNVTKVREIICALFFYTEGGYDIGKSLENAITFVENAPLIAMPHFDEIYLALSRTSNRYEDEHECIKGDEQTFDLSDTSNLKVVFSFDHYMFNEKGKLYIDGVEVSKENYDISKGSTVITIKNSYLSTLSEGKHIIVAKIDNDEADAHFSVIKKSNDINTNEEDNPTNVDTEISDEDKEIEVPVEETNVEVPTKENNSSIINNNAVPQTGDNIIFYILILGLSVLGLLSTGIYIKKNIN